MKRTTRTIRLFLASPGDTREERAAVATVVADLNRQQGRRDRFTIDLIRWEDDAYPAGPDDPQSLINRQIGDYEIFVGVMRTVFGTPTARAGSGTEDEFDRAFERNVEHPGSVSILFYFCNASVKTLEVDAYELLQIQRFRQRIRSLGFLTWDVSSPDELRRQLAHHLTRHVLAIVTPASNTLGATAAAGTHLSIKLNDWHGSTMKVYPQWASYRAVPLERHSYNAFSLRGQFSSSSEYFRFGFKLLIKGSGPFGDGSIQAQNNNLVIHIGKNTRVGPLFLTSYYNGVRQHADRDLFDYKLGDRIDVELSVSVDDTCIMSIGDHEVYRAHISRHIRDRCLMMAWGDQHDYEVLFRDIALILE